jgi:hypothetical protein
LALTPCRRRSPSPFKIDDRKIQGGEGGVSSPAIAPHLFSILATRMDQVPEILGQTSLACRGLGDIVKRARDFN